MADAEEVAASITKRDGVAYTGLWLNTRGLDRALQTPLDMIGAIRVTASEQFAMHNTGMDHAQTHAEQRSWLERYREAGVPTKWGYVMTAFGCNYQGEVPVEPTSATASPRSSTSPTSSTSSSTRCSWPTRSASPVRRRSSG